MKRAEQTNTAPTYAELDLAATHEAKAIVDGNDDCRCCTCQKVDRYLAEKTEGRSA